MRMRHHYSFRKLVIYVRPCGTPLIKFIYNALELLFSGYNRAN